MLLLALFIRRSTVWTLPAGKRKLHTGHNAAAQPRRYTVLSCAALAMASAACIPPSPYTDPAGFLAITDATGHRSLDMGDYFACTDLGHKHCIVNAAVVVGVCVPYACGVADIVNASGPLFLDYIAPQAPIIPYAAALSGVLTATCNDGSAAYTLDSNGEAFMAGLAAMAAAVLVATLCVLSRRVGGGKHAPHRRGHTAASASSRHHTVGAEADSRGGGRPSSRCAALLATCGRDLADKTSLTRTLPAVFQCGNQRTGGKAEGGGVGLAGTPRAVDFSALNGIRVLSISLVILGHTFLMGLTTGETALHRRVFWRWRTELLASLSPCCYYDDPTINCPLPFQAAPP